MSDSRKSLIAALEAATGPSRELDAAIHCLLTGRIKHSELPAGYTMEDAGTAHRNRNHALANFITRSRGPAPYYTESIDAALTLMPKGVGFALLVSFLDGTAHAAVSKDKDEAPQLQGEANATPAIALCIAGLRAGGDA